MTRKEEILNAVINGFHQEGFTMEMTLSQIAKKVNIAKSTLYEYFKNKEEMYTEAILLMISKNVSAALQIDRIDELVFKDAFKAQLSLLLNVACQSRMMLEMFTKNFINKLPDSIRIGLQKTMEQATIEISNRFIMIFTKGINEGLLQPNLDPIKVEVITCMIVGGVVRVSDKSLNIDENAFVDEVYQTALLLGK